jgi:hypothetical protein
MSTRTVQLELTLDVDVDCKFENGNWQLKDVERIVCRGTTISSQALDHFMHFNTQTADELAELFAQQEP